MVLETTKHVCTGESKCRFPKHIKTILNNTPITQEEIYSFLECIAETNLGLKVTFMDRKTTKIWGRAYYENRKIVLYRKSVAVFLHEMSHIMGYVYYGITGHNTKFCDILDWMYQQWLANMDLTKYP